MASDERELFGDNMMLMLRHLLFKNTQRRLTWDRMFSGEDERDPSEEEEQQEEDYGDGGPAPPRMPR